MRRTKVIALEWLAILLILPLGLNGCSLISLDPEQAARQTQVRATELELHVAQTLISQQSTAQGVDQTAATEAVTAPTTEVVPATEPAGETPEPPLETGTIPLGTAPPLATEVPAVEASELSKAELLERMQTANILLYEDMVARTNTNRYAKDTLNRMGLTFKDDGNAQGWLLNDLKDGAPNGKPWDLVILALEDKTRPQGEFVPLALQTLQSGPASVILETWFLNDTHTGSAQDLLGACGVEFQSDRRGIAPGIMILYKLIPDHPLLNQPNSEISLTDTMGYWWDPSGVQIFDTGDTLRLAPGSTAQMVIGAKEGQKTSSGTLVVCMEDRLILQTFSSHNFTFDTGTLLWENYITQALRTRFEAGP